MINIFGKIYFRENYDGTSAASINLTGNVDMIKMVSKEKLLVQVDETGRKITMIPMDDVTI